MTRPVVADGLPPRPELGEGKNLLVNGRFEKGLKGWEAKAWNSKGKVTLDKNERHESGAVACFDNPAVDDTHLRQEVHVKPHTTYLLTAFVKTEGVQAEKEGNKWAGASVALEGGYTKSQSVLGTTPWNKIALVFETKDETVIKVGARLGFHSGLASGKAWFANISLVEVENAKN